MRMCSYTGEWAGRGKGRVFKMVRIARGYGRVVAAALPCLAAACASPMLEPPVSATAQAQAEARRSYDACLDSASRYADDGKTTAPQLALIVAPLCYESFLRLEKVISAGLGGSARRAFEHGADDGQLNYAMAAIRKERSPNGERLAAAP